MKKSKGKKKVFHSMMEFEKEFFPKSFKKRMLEKPANAHDLGISLAKESLDIMRARLTK